MSNKEQHIENRIAELIDKYMEQNGIMKKFVFQKAGTTKQALFYRKKNSPLTRLADALGLEVVITLKKKK